MHQSMTHTSSRLQGGWEDVEESRGCANAGEEAPGEPLAKRQDTNGPLKHVKSDEYATELDSDSDSLISAAVAAENILFSPDGRAADHCISRCPLWFGLTWRRLECCSD